MKSAVKRMSRTLGCVVTIGAVLVLTSGVLFAQPQMGDVLKEKAKEGAMEMMGVKKPVQGQAEMMDGAKKVMDGKKMLKADLVKNDKIKEGAPLEGELKMSEGYEMILDGDKMIQAQNTAEGKKKMLDGAKIMADAKTKMVGDLTKKGLVKEDKPSEGELMMKDGEKKMKDAEMMMLK